MTSPFVTIRALAALLAISSSLTYAQTTTASADTTRYTSRSTLKLARRYVGQDFMNQFDFFTDDDPTQGFVNYVSKSDASSASLVDVQSDNTFIMRADSSSIATGRGRDSIRISSKDKFADGVYILDMNHMPVGCGTWPAFWTVTKDGWPVGGEIDILEGANGLPLPGSAAFEATTGLSNTSLPQIANVAALHTSQTCDLAGGTYMSGSQGIAQCSAYVSGNTGCGVRMTDPGNGTYGGPINAVGGGWYAMWRDLKNSGGVYVYFWPRTSPNVPEDVRNFNTATTNTAGWGIPAANLSVPSCTGDFNNHVIVFDLTFCGDYAGATYASTGCPGSCQNFVRNFPAAFSEAYWSVNSLRVYTTSGKPASGSGLSTGAIVGIVVGVVAALVIAGLVFWRYKTSRRRRQENQIMMADDPSAIPEGPYTFLASRKPRLGPTTLAPGRTARHLLDGETPSGSVTPAKGQPSGGGIYGQSLSGSGSGSDASIKVPDTSTFIAPHARDSSMRSSFSATAQSSPAKTPAKNSFVARAAAKEQTPTKPLGGSSWIG
ncbi:hypothetical protein IAR55_001470 [Kwoniella newhampshirensis]|uniref:GH16 domain-containing protein n=1 Tax=Kwoniella newhampshirensis TaxID=1651941 RepID=A0AAW0Z2F9_9TREE